MSRDLFKKDDPTRFQIRQALSEWIDEGSGLILHPDLLQERKKRCQGCGGSLKNPKTYFDQEFCGECVEKWKSGHK